MKKLQILTVTMLLATGLMIQAGGQSMNPTEASVAKELGGTITLPALQTFVGKTSSTLTALTTASTAANYLPVIQAGETIQFALEQLTTATVPSVTAALGGTLSITSLQAYFAKFIQDLEKLTASSTINDYQPVLLEMINIDFALKQLVPKPTK